MAMQHPSLVRMCKYQGAKLHLYGNVRTLQLPLVEPRMSKVIALFFKHISIILINYNQES